MGLRKTDLFDVNKVGFPLNELAIKTFELVIAFAADSDDFNLLALALKLGAALLAGKAYDR